MAENNNISTMKPKVSVLMPAYNSENYVENAVNSILEQTFSDFEFIIINDGSTDRTRDILYSFNDPRVRIIDNDQNIGLVLSLNKGLELSRGEYIARMDADDISLPERLEVQVQFMEDNPEIGLCGSYVKVTGDGGGKEWHPPRDHEDIICNLFFTSSLAHPSVMMRKKVLDDYKLLYDNTYDGAEDYYMWVRMSSYCKLANIDKVLLHYNRHNNTVTSLKYATQLKSSNKVRHNQLIWFIKDVSDDEIETHNIIGSLNKDEIKVRKKEALQWLYKLKHLNEVKHHYPEPAFSNCIYNKKKWIYNHTQPGMLSKLNRIKSLMNKLHKKY